MKRLIVAAVTLVCGLLITACGTTYTAVTGKKPPINDPYELVKSNSGMEVNCLWLVEAANVENTYRNEYAYSSGKTLIQIDATYFGKKFGDWNNDDIEFINETLDRCDGSQWNNYRIYKYHNFDHKKIKKIYNDSYESIAAQKEAVARREQQAEAQRIYQARQEQCRARNPKAYEIFDAQKDVISAFNALQPWMDRLEEQKQIAEMSGVVNLQQQRHLGEITYTHSQRLLKAFNKYKSAGGTAKSPAELKLKPYPNPCIGI